METRPGVWTGALVGLLLTAPLIALAYLANQFTGLPFPPFDLFDGITRVLPGPIVTFGIDLMIDISVVSTAKTAEQLMSVGLFAGLGIVIGAVFSVVPRWRQPLSPLRAPLSELTWVTWRYDWPFEAGNHLFEVRCAEADGTRQIEEARPQQPSGSRGIHSLEENI